MRATNAPAAVANDDPRANAPVGVVVVAATAAALP